MITTPTVLILGAGASKPYDYPVGPELVAGILRRTGSGGELRRLLGPRPDLIPFNERLAASDVDSIDDFLTANPSLTPLGRLAIAAELTVWAPANGHRPKAGDWYRYLWGCLREDAPESMDFRQNRLKVITYNYDGSLERYLASRAMAFYPDINAQGEEAGKELADGVVPVLHLHGALGKDADVIHMAEDRGQFLHRDILERIAKGIVTVHEPEAERLYVRARNWLSEAKAVHILGFGYHNKNVARLGLKGLVDDGASWAQIGGTALGLPSPDRSRKEALLGVGSGILHDVDCLGYLRDRVGLS